MDAADYRSYVVRIWGRGGTATRVLVEEVRSGWRIDLRGGAAARLSACLEAALRPAREGIGAGSTAALAEPRASRR